MNDTLAALTDWASLTKVDRLQAMLTDQRSKRRAAEEKAEEKAEAAAAAEKALATAEAEAAEAAEVRVQIADEDRVMAVQVLEVSEQLMNSCNKQMSK